MRRRLRNRLAFFLVLLLFAVANPIAWADDVVVIAHPSSAVASISKDELRQILLANRTHWENGKRISVFALNSDDGRSDPVFRELMGMTFLQAKKHWLTKVFNGVLPTAPQVGSSVEEVSDLVARTPDSIAVLPQGASVGTAKTVPLTQ